MNNDGQLPHSEGLTPPKAQSNNTAFEAMRAVSVLLVFCGFVLNYHIFATNRADRRDDKKREVSSYWIQETVSKPAIESLKSLTTTEENWLRKLGQPDYPSPPQRLESFTQDIDELRRSFVPQMMVFDENSYNRLSDLVEEFENEYTILLTQRGTNKPIYTNSLVRFRNDICKELYQFHFLSLADEQKEQKELPLII